MILCATRPPCLVLGVFSERFWKGKGGYMLDDVLLPLRFRAVR